MHCCRVQQPALQHISTTLPQIYKDITTGKRPPLPADLTSLPGGTFPGMGTYVELMQQCWAQQPAERPSFAEITARLRELEATC